jgi:hypothetical protein
VLSGSTLDGGPGDDALNGTPAADLLFGDAGDDPGAKARLRRSKVIAFGTKDHGFAVRLRA